MSNATVTGRVLYTERVATSTPNPMFDVALTDGNTYRTSANVSLAYAIENPEYRDNLHTFELTRAGRLNGRVERACDVYGQHSTIDELIACKPCDEFLGGN